MTWTAADIQVACSFFEASKSWHPHMANYQLA